MDSRQNRRQFAASWLHDAVAETVKSSHLASMWVALVIVVLGTLLNWYRLRHPAHGAVHQVNFFVALWPSLVVAGVVLFFFFLFHLFAMPYRIATEAKDQHEKELRSKQDEHQATQALLDQERTEHQAAKSQLSSRQVSQTHFSDLNQTVASLAHAVSNSQECHPRGDLDRNAFFAHWPEFFGEMTRWNDSRQRRQAITDAFTGRLDREIPEAGIVPGPYNVPVIKQRVTEVVVDHVNKQLLDMPMQFQWKEWGSTSDDLEAALKNGGVVGWLGLGEPIIDSRSAAEQSLTVSKCKETLEELVNAARTWPETLALGDRDTPESFALQLSLNSELERLRRLSTYNQVEGCPLCP